MSALCDICNARPAVARVTVMQNGERKTLSICDYHYRQLMRHQEALNPFDSLLGGSGGGLSRFFGGHPGHDDDEEAGYAAEVPRESVDATDAFSEQTLELLQQAAQKATELRRTELDTEHLLYELADTDVAAALFKELKLSPQDIKTYIDTHAKTGNADPDSPNEKMTVSPRLKKAFQHAFQASRDLGHSYVGPEHLLIGLSQVPDSIAGTLLKKYGVTPEAIRQKVVKVVGKGAEDGRVEGSTGTPNLDKFGRDLTALARQGKLDPVFGRAVEIENTIEVLARRRKNNPVLIGEPGVGKTAIVEGLAQRIVNGDVPEVLRGKRVVEVNINSMVAGAKYRGEFEERAKQLIDEVTAKKDELILFIDELHTIVGAGQGGGEGGLDIANVLKPALARGELSLIGATTLSEYQKYIEKDAALERRFQKVLVEEPSVEATIAILRGLQEKYELHHGVDITDPAIVAAAELSHRYITDRFLPDKAIDLIDEAASKIKMEIDSKPEEMDKLDRRLIQLKIEREAVKKEKDEASQKRLALIEEEIERLGREYADLEEIWTAEKAAVQGSAHLKEEIERVRAEIVRLQREGKLEKVAELQYGKLPQLEAQLKEVTRAEETEQQKHPRLLRTQVGAEEIADVVSRATGIPVSRMMQGEREKLLHIEEKLHERVIGQNEAIDAVADAIRRSRAGLSDPNRPYGSFLFLGPTGVGKTELCKALARFLFDSEDHLIRIDMSEFMEKHSVARLIGAPPGYVGYEEGGYLTEAVRRKPYSVVLLDEIEKAHPDVFNILLQVLDDGRLTDGQGRTVDFRNTVIVMTSNLGSHLIQSMADAPQAEIKDAVWEEVKQHFRPEFLNRIDDVVVFHSLDQRNIESIAKIQLAQLRDRLAKLDMSLDVTDAALEKIAKVGFDPLFGARPLKRAIQQEIENPVAKLILAGRFGPKDVIPVDVQDGKFSFDRVVH